MLLAEPRRPVGPHTLGLAPCAAWRLNPAVELHWQLIDADWLLYDNSSGMTHQLDALRAAALMAFEDGHPLDHAALLAQLQADLGPVDLQSGQLDTLLLQFCQLDLLLPATGLHHTTHAAA